MVPQHGPLMNWNFISHNTTLGYTKSQGRKSGGKMCPVVVNHMIIIKELENLKVGAQNIEPINE